MLFLESNEWVSGMVPTTWVDIDPLLGGVGVGRADLIRDHGDQLKYVCEQVAGRAANLSRWIEGWMDVMTVAK